MQGQGQDGDSVDELATETNNIEYDSEMEFLSREIISPPPSRSRMIAVACLNPRRTIQSIVRFLWGTLKYLVRTLITRLFAMVGLPVSSLISYLRPHPMSDHIAASPLFRSLVFLLPALHSHRTLANQIRLKKGKGYPNYYRPSASRTD